MASIYAATKATGKAIKSTFSPLGKGHSYQKFTNQGSSWYDSSVTSDLAKYGHSQGMVIKGSHKGNVSKTVHNGNARDFELLPRSDYLTHYGGPSTRLHLDVPSISGRTAPTAASASTRDVGTSSRTPIAYEGNAISGNYTSGGRRTTGTGTNGRSVDRATTVEPSRRNVGVQATSIGGDNQSANSAKGHGGDGSGKSIVAGAAIASTASGISGIAQTKMRSKTAMQMQKSSQDYNTGLINQHKSALSEVGLPSYLAYGGNASALPKMGQVTGGRSIYHAKLPGNSMSQGFMGNHAQLSAGWGSVI